MNHLGKFKPGSKVRYAFGTYAAATAAPSAMTGNATSDILVYKDGNTTERASAAGITFTADFDSKTAINYIEIDLADNTTADFYAAGSFYIVVVGDITIDSVTYRFPAFSFEIDIPGSVLATTIATLSSQTSFTLTVGPAEDNALKGCDVYIHDAASAVQCAMGVVSGYTGSTKTVTLAFDPAIFTVAAKDNVLFLPRHNAHSIAGAVQSTFNSAEQSSRMATLIEAAPGSPNEFRFTADALERSRIVLGMAAGNLDTQLAGIQSDTDNLQTRIPAALISGRMDVTVGAMQANVMTAAAAAADLTTELQTGLATATSVTTAQAILDRLNSMLEAAPGSPGESRFTADALERARIVLGMAAGNLDTQLAGIQSDTNDIQTRLPAALISGRMDVTVGAMQANVMTAAAAAADLTTELQTGLATASSVVTAQAILDRLSTMLEAAPGSPGESRFTADALERLRIVIGMAAGNLDTQLAGLQSDTNDIQTRLPAALISGRLDVTVGAMQANVMTAAAAASDLTTELQTGLATSASLSAFTDKFNTMVEPAPGSPGEYRYTADALVRAPTGSGGGSAPSAADIADAVWDEAAAGHVSAGSFGALVLKTGSNAATTFASLTVTGKLLVSDGVEINTVTANRSAIKATSNLAGHALELISVDGAGIEINSSDGFGINIWGGISGIKSIGVLNHGLDLQGQQNGILATGFDYGGIKAVSQGGSAMELYGDTDALLLSAGTGKAINAVGEVFISDGLVIEASTTDKSAVNFTGDGDGAAIQLQAGFTGLAAIQMSSTKYGIYIGSQEHCIRFAPGENFDGMSFDVSGTGVAIRGDIIGNLSEVIVDKLDTTLQSAPGSPGEYRFTSDALEMAPSGGGGGGASAGDIAIAVWDELTAGHAVSGSFGKRVVDNLDASVSTRATQTSVDTIDNFLDDEVAAMKLVLDRVGTMLEAAPGSPGEFRFTADSVERVRIVLGLAAANLDAQLGTLLSGVVNLSGRIPAALISGRIDATIGAMQANVMTAAATAADFVTELQSGLATSTALALVAAIIDKLNTTLELAPGSPGEYRFTSDALELAPTSGGGGSAPTVSQIVAGVWGEVLPGAYGVNSAGKIIGDNVNAPLSDVASFITRFNTMMEAASGSPGEYRFTADALVLVPSGGLNAIQLRAAIGLAAPNLDTQLDGVPTALENADALLNRDMSLVSDTNARSPLNAMRFLRNKWDIVGTTLSVKKENDSTEAWNATVTPSPGADPISGNDPS